MIDMLYQFVGGTTGTWKVERVSPVTGRALPLVQRLAILYGSQTHLPQDQMWVLRGVTSYERYVQKAERAALAARQQSLGRPGATRAALIPIKKSADWWALAQDERRLIFEARSHHIATGLKYLPAIARRLYHGYDLGEPFDFLTWFEYAPGDAEAFEELVGLLRETEEWAFVGKSLQQHRKNWDDRLGCMHGAYVFTETIWETDWKIRQHPAKMGSQGDLTRVS